LAADIRLLTPFSVTEISICNTSAANAGYTTSANIGVPQIKVASGNYQLWNANERWQCYWSEEKIATNDNDVALSGLNASANNPSRASDGLGTGSAQGTYTVRVQVCPASPTTLTDDEKARCKSYPSGNRKPIGLLQKYGERNEAGFGLITGSFNKNTSGGVLRKNISSFTNEVNLTTGLFTNADGIVKTLNTLRMYGYNYDDGTYNNAVDDCPAGMAGLSDGICGSWGNPMGEVYLEALRYLAGKTPTAAYDTSAGKDAALGLSIAAWADPFADSTVTDFGQKLCRRSSIINFNASVTSYDNDQWSTQSDIGMTGSLTVETLTNAIGAAEQLYAAGSQWAVGSTTANTDRFCSAKTITALSTSTGICPAAPTYSGGFKIAGAAYYAHTNPVRTDITIPAANTRAFKVDTYGVALATGQPRISVPVPGQAGKFVVITPTYRNSGVNGGGTLVDFRVVSKTNTAGKFIVQWDDSEQGSDFDQDLWGTLEYSVSASAITVSTKIIAESTGGAQGFGYTISGTNKDGVHFHSGIYNFTYADPAAISVTPTTNLNGSGGCNSCNVADAKTTATYTMTGTSSGVLQDPLWYAAKYGGYDVNAAASYVPSQGSVLPTSAWDTQKTDGTAGSDGNPDTFFYAIEPAQLEKSLELVFTAILKAGGAAPAAATSSKTVVGGYVFASTESIKPRTSLTDADNSGEFWRYSLSAIGAFNTDWDAGLKLTDQVSGSGWDTGRVVFTMNDTGPATFRWDSLSAAQQSALRQSLTAANTLDTDTVAQNRLNWLRGDSTNETTATGGLRIRSKTKLGAIVNSTPWYIGPPRAGYTNAAYVPRAMYTTSAAAPYSKLAALTAKDFLLSDGANRNNVDGSVMAADMKVSVGGTPTWRTYLFGAFGRGGRGIYALDVTSPQTITTESAGNATSVVKWEFTEAADADMGYVTGRTNIRNNGQPWQSGYMANGKWAAIYGNGYNSTGDSNNTARAALFIVFADGPASANAATGWTAGTHYVKLLTGTAGNGPDNGLASPTAVDTDNDGTINTIYAGDLKGNVWKFDVSDANPANWGVGTKDANNAAVPVFSTAITSGSTRQPITTAVVPFAHPQGGYQLFVGTGKGLESSDYPMNSVYTNTLYSIWDRPGTVGTITTGGTLAVNGRNSTGLVQQTSQTSNGVRYISKNTVSYPTNKGWYLDLPVSSESVIFNPYSEDTLRINVRSIAPQGTTDGCRYDGTAFDASINPINGTPIANAVPDAAAIANFGAVGKTSTNNFEFSRGGVFKLPNPEPSLTACTAGSTNCVCNPAVPTQCVLCPDPATCSPPWKPLPSNQCAYATISALGGGGLQSTVKYGGCVDGRVTWREIFSNRP